MSKAAKVGAIIAAAGSSERMCSLVKAWKTTVASIRLRNSGER
ncbi:unnamed protein product, partial [marine sediment metagenome]